MALAGVARAEEVFSLTTDDFTTAKVTLERLDDASLTVASGDAVSMPLARMISLVKAKPAASAAISGLVLCTLDGDRLVGTPQKLEGNNLVWFASGVGSVRVPLERCTGVLRDKTDSIDLLTSPGEDRAKLVTGDTVSGIVSDVTDKGFVLTPASGAPATLASDAIASLIFAAPPGGRAAALADGMLVHVTGGTIVRCTAVSLPARPSGNPRQITLTLADKSSVAIPFEQVTQIENFGGTVSWLSARTPVASEFTPFFGGNFPARFDRTVTGAPIRFGGVTYTHGIGVHSRSKLTFDIRPGDQTFRTRYALDGNLGYGDVDVRVSVDGKVVHAAKAFHAGTLSPVISADVAGAKTLTLEVDYGGGYDVQDRLNWIEPAMLRAAKAR